MLFKRYHGAILCVQLILVAASVALAWLLRFDFSFPQRPVFLMALPLLLLLRFLSMCAFNLFHGYWRYTGIKDALDVLKAVALGSLAFLVAERWIVGVKGFPISVYFIETILSTVMLIGIRVFSRAMAPSEHGRSRRSTDKRVVIIGAGCGASMLLRELPRAGYTPLALVDDDAKKTGVALHGVTVRGRVCDLQEVVRRYHPNELLIAIPSATGEQMSRITECCGKTGLPFRTIPGLGDMIRDKAAVEQLRRVNLEDLLGREAVHLDLDTVRRSIAGRVVMVTGAAGSIGSELSRQLLRYSPEKLVCVDQAETPLFYLQQANAGAQAKTAYCVADIANRARMTEIIREHDVRVIFHAAAYKHVPLMEQNLQEALNNNVFGLLSLLEAADESGCDDFLFISSDKAVSPTSFMGCTKRIGELIIAGRPAAHMRCLSVRFGNVLGSQGSVIPIFQEQIRTRRQITVTHPEISRYFMTIPEAVSLVLQAFAIGGRGDTLVLDMGKPVRILDMAKALIRLSGIAQSEVKITFTGLRPGEKLFEELFYGFEQRLSTTIDKVLRTRGPAVRWPELLAALGILRAESLTGVSARIRTQMRQIVPQYQWAAMEDGILGSTALTANSPGQEVQFARTVGYRQTVNGERTLAAT